MALLYSNPCYNEMCSKWTAEMCYKGTALYYDIYFQTILEQGGLAPGGLNFDCKVRRESTNLKDMFISHIGAMDSFARGLKVAAKLKEEGVMDKHVKVKPLYYTAKPV